MVVRKGMSSSDPDFDPQMKQPTEPSAPADKFPFDDPFQAPAWFARRWKKGAMILVALIALRVGYLGVKQSPFQVPNGNKGIVMYFGKIDHVVNEGLNWKFPFWSSVAFVNIQNHKTVITADAVSSDNQKVTVEVTANWLYDPTKVDKVYREIGTEAALTDGIMVPALQESLKASTAKRKVGIMLDQREAMKQEIEDKFTSKMKDYPVKIVNMYLTNLRFDKDYEDAIEKKQIAEVGVKTAENVADAVRKEAAGAADAMLIRATGEAKSKHLLSSTVSEAVLALEWINAWKAGGSQVPQIIMGGNSSFMMDLSKLKGSVRMPAAEPAGKK